MSIPSLTTALCLPSLDIEALLQGRMIVAMSNTFRNPLQFALCPIPAAVQWQNSFQEKPPSDSHYISRYRQSFLRSLPNIKVDNNPQEKLTSPILYAWAKFGKCHIYTQKSTQHSDLAALSRLTVWSPDYLKGLLQIQPKIFVISLQVYRFEQPVKIDIKPITADGRVQWVAEYSVLPDQ